MNLPVVLVAALVLLTVEAVICCNCPKRSWQAVLPTLVGLTTAGMWVSFYVKPAFSTYILGLICLIWTGAVLLGWGLFCIVKKLRDKKK